MISYILVYLLIVTSLGRCLGSRVLVVFPVPRRSHGVLGNSIVKTLLEAGHEVTYVTPFPRDLSSEKLTYVDISSAFERYDQPKLSALLESAPPLLDTLHHGPDFSQRVLQHDAVQELLQDATEVFNVIIADWYFSGLLAPLANLYSCPLIWYSTLELSWHQLQLMHEASSPVYSADVNSYHLPSKPYGMWERWRQTWLQIYLSAWGYYITKNVEIPAYRAIYELPLTIRGRPLLEYELLVYNASLMLINSHPPHGQGIPTPGNIRLVGGHHVELPLIPLPQKLKAVLDNSKTGAILFNLGPDHQSKDLPESLKRQLIRLFEELEQTIIWQLEEKLEFRPKNVHVIDLESQHLSILNHPNTIILITAGDATSIIEATYSGVPIIGLPLLGDQFLNVDLAVERGCGIRVDAAGLVVKELKEAINEISSNHSYQSNTKTASSIFHRRQPPTYIELQHWINFIISTQGAKHLRSPAIDLSIFKRYNLDTLAVCGLLIWFLSKVVRVVKVYLRDDEYYDKKNE